MPNFARDINIGYPEPDTVNVNVKVDEAIGVALKEVTDRLDDTTEELRKIKTGTGLNISIDLDEEVA